MDADELERMRLELEVRRRMRGHDGQPGQGVPRVGVSGHAPAPGQAVPPGSFLGRAGSVGGGGGAGRPLFQLPSPRLALPPARPRGGELWIPLFDDPNLDVVPPVFHDNYRRLLPGLNTDEREKPAPDVSGSPGELEKWIDEKIKEMEAIIKQSLEEANAATSFNRLKRDRLDMKRITMARKDAQKVLKDAMTALMLAAKGLRGQQGFQDCGADMLRECYRYAKCMTPTGEAFANAMNGVAAEHTEDDQGNKPGAVTNAITQLRGKFK